MSSPVQFFWDPQGFQLDYLGVKKAEGEPADGDTPYVKMPIRMLGIDTPETSYPGAGTAEAVDDKFYELAQLLKAGVYTIDEGLANYLIPKLETGDAGSTQRRQGVYAKQYFKELMDQRLTKPNGKKRSLFMHAPSQPFDHYGRLLAYIAPKYTNEELLAYPPQERGTFNYLMVKSGWAAPIMIYPNLPKDSDLRIVHGAVKHAVENGIGAWEDPLMLTGYEYRMCIKMYKAIKKLDDGEFNLKPSKYVSRFCVDMTNSLVYYPDEYFNVPVANRMFVWANDIRQAVADLNLRSAEGNRGATRKSARDFAVNTGKRTLPKF